MSVPDKRPNVLLSAIEIGLVGLVVFAAADPGLFQTGLSRLVSDPLTEEQRRVVDIHLQQHEILQGLLGERY